MNKKNKIIIGVVAVCLIAVGIGFNSMFSKGNDIADASNSKIEKNLDDENKLKTNLEEEEADKQEDKEKEEDTEKDKEKEKEEENANKDKEENKDEVADNSNESDTNSTNSGNTQTDSNKNPEPTPTPVVPKKDTVTIAIDCATAINNGVNNESGFTHLPSSGIILGTKTVEITEGETVFSVLQRVVRDNGIHMEYTGSASTIYVEGIHNLYEFDGGKDSGWMYSVNGWYPNYGAGSYKLKANDVIKWRYTCNLGSDLGR